MLDPRIDIANMLYELREKLNELECKLWEIPHHEEPVAEYDAVYTAPQSGDYMHPDTPTHENQKVSATRLTGIHVVNVGWNLLNGIGIHTTTVITQMQI